MRTQPSVATVFIVLVALAVGNTVVANDPLPSWNDGKAKQSIVAFVQKVTTTGSPDFVPIEERIAVFDNDGTLCLRIRCRFKWLMLWTLSAKIIHGFKACS